MRLRRAVAMLIFAGAVAASAQSSDPFTLRISGPGTVTAGQQVPVRVLLLNTSNHPIAVVEPIIMDDLVPSIQGPAGQELPLKCCRGGSMGMGSLRPNEVQDDVLRVDFLYDLSGPGKYTLQLKRPIAEDRSAKDGFVSSNVITFTVSPEAIKPSAPLVLSLSGPATFVSGSDVSLKVSARNISDQNVFLVTDPDGSIADRYCGLKSIVGPNHAEIDRHLAHESPGAIQTIVPGATLNALIGKKALGFTTEWTQPTNYSFQLICSVPGYTENDNGRTMSNAFALDVTPAPPDGPTPFTLKLSGPGAVVAGDAVRVTLEETNTGGDNLAEEGEMSPLEHSFSSLGYSLSVRDPSGHELPLNARVNLVPAPHTLQSMESVSSSHAYVVLSDFYDMSQPGAYRVQISKIPLVFTKAGQVFSNPITINVASGLR